MLFFLSLVRLAGRCFQAAERRRMQAAAAKRQPIARPCRWLTGAIAANVSATPPQTQADACAMPLKPRGSRQSPAGRKPILLPTNSAEEPPFEAFSAPRPPCRRCMSARHVRDLREASTRFDPGRSRHPRGDRHRQPGEQPRSFGARGVPRARRRGCCARRAVASHGDRPPSLGSCPRRSRRPNSSRATCRPDRSATTSVARRPVRCCHRPWYCRCRHASSRPRHHGLAFRDGTVSMTRQP